MHGLGYDQGELRFIGYRLASVLGMLGQPRLSNLQMAQLVGLEGVFPGIKMRSHDTNRVYGKANTFRLHHAAPTSRVVVEV